MRAIHRLTPVILQLVLVMILLATLPGRASLIPLTASVLAGSGVRAVTLIPSVGGDSEARDYLALFDLNIRRLTEALAGVR